MRYDFYSRTNQLILDGAIVGLSFCLAYQLRYAGHLPPNFEYQMWALVLPVVAGRLLTSFAFGLHRIQWRYVSIRDAGHIAGAYFAFSSFLFLLRFGLPEQWPLLRIPGTVITIELLLSTQGALAIRLLRRFIYERRSRRSGIQSSQQPRRLLLIGAGMMGSTVAKELASRPGIEVVGFLDDDPRKMGCLVAGMPVLGPISLLPEFARTRKIDDVLVCISPAARKSFIRLWALLENLPIPTKFVPTVEEVLNSKDGLHVKVGPSLTRDELCGSRVTSKHQLPPLPSPRIRNSTVLITGGAGFIGSSLAERLVADNRLILLDRVFREQPISFTSLMKHRNVRIVEADIMNGDTLSVLAQEADIVIHAAAIVGVDRVCTYPRETLETNFVGTSRLLQALEGNHRLQRVVYFSTSEVFGVNSFRVQEDAPTAVGSAAEARWSYAIAKLAGEHLVKSYHRQTGMPVVIVRPFNIFGPKRVGAHAILHFVLNALKGNAIEVHGDGSQIRSWCYIEDFCEALIEMIARPEALGEDFNIGNPLNTVTIYQLAQKVLEHTGASVPIVFTESAFPDIGIRVPALGKARRILGYEPRYDLDQGLSLTIDWYRKHLDFFERRLNPVAAAV
jgi:nucleoside-diphosphate-sugar epimerase